MENFDFLKNSRIGLAKRNETLQTLMKHKKKIEADSFVKETKKECRGIV
jgi:hypothetical protein